MCHCGGWGVAKRRRTATYRPEDLPRGRIGWAGVALSPVAGAGTWLCGQSAATGGCDGKRWWLPRGDGSGGEEWQRRFSCTQGDGWGPGWSTMARRHEGGASRGSAMNIYGGDGRGGEESGAGDASQCGSGRGSEPWRGRPLGIDGVGSAGGGGVGGGSAKCVHGRCREAAKGGLRFRRSRRALSARRAILFLRASRRRRHACPYDGATLADARRERRLTSARCSPPASTKRDVERVDKHPLGRIAAPLMLKHGPLHLLFPPALPLAFAGRPVVHVLRNGHQRYRFSLAPPPTHPTMRHTPWRVQTTRSQPLMVPLFPLGVLTRQAHAYGQPQQWKQS